MRGVEKESLRVQTDGALSLLAHPPALGSALTHPKITTDFCEAQLELITTVHPSAETCLDELIQTHCYVYKHIQDELLWCASMPCVAPNDDAIPFGQYGTSNIGRVKNIYRRGLGLRYGRLMQTISGIHYNFSLPAHTWDVLAEARGTQNTQAFRTHAYFELIRNFRRNSWLLILLFGASPAICKCFIQNQQHNLKEFDDKTLYLPWATSLRMGNLGYQSDAQSQLHISYNSLDEYASSMHHALSTPYALYEQKGIKSQGQYQQLNTNLIQIENEFYGTIRPKRTVKSSQRPLAALYDKGVEYVEVRCLDLNPFLPVGIDAEQMQFLDTFLLHCLFSASPEDSPEESREMQANQLMVVERGRQPGISLSRNGEQKPLLSWAEQLLNECLDIAQIMHTSPATLAQQEKLANLSLTPSAQILAQMESEQSTFADFAMQQSRLHKSTFNKCAWDSDNLQHMDSLTEGSIKQQAEIEQSDTISLDAFIEDYVKLAELEEMKGKA